MLDFQKSGLDLNRLISEAAERDVLDWCAVKIVSRDMGRIPAADDLADHLAGMARAFGIDGEALTQDDATYADLLSVCRMCAEKGACRKVAASNSVNVMDECGFCPNWITLLDLSPVAA